MQSNTVLIGCKLPQGIIVEVEGKKLKLNGMNTAMIAGGYGLTTVSADQAAIFFATHADFGPVVSNAIFTHNSDDIASIVDLGDELKDERTGFEGLDPTKPAAGLKPDDKQATNQQGVETAPIQRAKALSKADKKAAAALAAATQGGK